MTPAPLRYHRKIINRSGEIVHKTLAVAALIAAIAAPAAVMAASIDASLIPDGTYTVKVNKVVDAKHIDVSMDNGSEATLTTSRDTVDFSKIKVGDQVKLSLIKGQVMVYLDLTSQGH
jgi:hypothetical protein